MIERTVGDSTNHRLLGSTILVSQWPWLLRKLEKIRECYAHQSMCRHIEQPGLRKKAMSVSGYIQCCGYVSHESGPWVVVLKVYEWLGTERKHSVFEELDCRTWDFQSCWERSMMSWISMFLFWRLFLHFFEKCLTSPFALRRYSLHPVLSALSTSTYVFLALETSVVGGPRVSLVLGGGHPASRQVGFMFLGSPRSQQEALQPFCSHAAVGG